MRTAKAYYSQPERMEMTLDRSSKLTLNRDYLPATEGRMADLKSGRLLVAVLVALVRHHRAYSVTVGNSTRLSPLARQMQRSLDGG